MSARPSRPDLRVVGTKVAFGSRAAVAARAHTCRSNIDTLRDGEGVVHLYPEIADGALDLRVAEQQLDGSEIAGPPVDEGHLRAAERMGAIEPRIQPDRTDPAIHQPGVVAGGDRLPAAPDPAWEKVVLRLAA